jgi:hypothetical protein
LQKAATENCFAKKFVKDKKRKTALFLNRQAAIL